MRRASLEHEAALPDHVPPMLMPETRADARLLLLCLETGHFPTYQQPTYQRAGEKEAGLGLSEAELMARGA